MKIFQLLIALALLLIGMPMAARANIDSVTPSPARISVPTSGAATLNIAWRVVRTANPAGGGGTLTVSSTNAVLNINGSAVATLGGTLSQQSTLAPASSGVVNFNETLTLSPALTRRVAAAGPGSVTLTRTFSDTEAVQGTGTIRVAAGNTGELSLRRIDLFFENQARTDVVKQGDTIRAVADVTFRSNGLLRGEWRIVDASASLGTARGRVLQVVRQQLVSSGEGRTRIVSPPLPTNTNGLHLISFSVEDTDGNFSTPILRYFVLEGSDNIPPVNVEVLTPGENTRLGEDTVFSWNTLPGAQAYQVEISPKGEDKPITGKLVPGSDVKLSLSALSLENLQSGRYDWRVRAFKNGSVIGTSEPHSLTIP